METGVHMAKKRSSGSPLSATIGSQARSSSPQPVNRRTFCTLPARNAPSSAAQQEDAVEVAHRLGFLGDDRGEIVEALLPVDGLQRVAHLLDPLADVALELGDEREVEDGDEAR